MIDTPQFEEPIRIISDLHFGHPASIIESPGQLTPLFRDCKTVVFNGDTVEMRYLSTRRTALENATVIRETCQAAGAHPVFINGNHDPIVSDLSHVDLVNGAILVTHGDLLFHDISPWSLEAGIMGQAHTRELAGLDEDAFLDFEKRLSASKRAALSIELHNTDIKRNKLSLLRTLLRECWPPWRPFQIIQSWAGTPARAEALARVFRPRARFILIGHTHWSGCWQRGPRMVINTGSFLPTGGRKAVDVQGATLAVRPILIEHGHFTPGPPVKQLAATRLLPDEGY